MKFLPGAGTMQTTSCVGLHLSERRLLRRIKTRGQSRLLLSAGILFGTAGVYAQHPEGGHPEGQHAEAPRSQPRNDVPRANQGRIPPAPTHREAPQGKPEAERHPNGKINETQQVADWDWPICADWCWDCGDDFVVYEDPDHIGWYMLYNVHGSLCARFLSWDLKAASNCRVNPRNSP